MTPIRYRYCHFPPAPIQHAVWLHARFTLSFRRAALELMRKLLKKSGFRPRTIVTDKLRSNFAAFRDLGLVAWHRQARWRNNRIEGSHVYVCRREREMPGYRSPGAAQRFLPLYAVTYNVFNTRRHLNSAARRRDCRRKAFAA